MKILVTGGAGYIATHTDVELLNAGYEVVIVDNLSNSCYEAVNRVKKIAGKQVVFYEMDLLDYEGLDSIFENENPDAVIHFAGLKAVGESCEIPLQYFDNNITGTINLLKCMEKHQVKQLVFSSSATVYGFPESVPINESAKLSVLNPYGRTKLIIEDMLRDLYASDSSWNIILLRYFNPIGAHSSGEIGEDPKGIPNNLVPYIAKVATGSLEKVSVYGNDYPTPDGTGVRDYIHVVDLAIGHVKAIEKLGTHLGIEVYNLGTGIGYSVLDVIRSYEKACGKEIPYEVVGRRAGDAPECYADPSKALHELGFQAERGIEKMCEDSYRWQSKNPDGYHTCGTASSAEEYSSLAEVKFIPTVESWEQDFKWYEKAVFYHIYPLGMCGADKIGDIDQEPTDKIRTLIDFIPHMQSLSIGGLYIGPLFESLSHGYDTTDYRLVDKRLGSNDDFKAFTAGCHEAGIKVVVDGVFNHTGREFFAFKDLREKKQNSQYIHWYCNVNFAGNNEFDDGFTYDAWHGYNILPKLNLKNPEVKNYLKDSIRFWVSEFDIDGIRLDTADVLDFDFMKELRTLSYELKPDFWLMGEVIHGDYSRWVNHEVLHSVTNYEMHKGLYSGHNDHNYFEIAHTVKRLFDKSGGIVKGETLYSFVENQDVDRLMNKLTDKAHMKVVYMLMFSLPGIPSIYYGGEFAMEGRHLNGSDDGIRPELKLEDQDMDSQLYKDVAWMARAHCSYKPFVAGEYQELMLTNRQYAFARVLEGEAVIAVVNNDNQDSAVEVMLPFGERVMDLETGKFLPAQDKRLKIHVGSCDGKMFYVNEKM